MTTKIMNLWKLMEDSDPMFRDIANGMSWGDAAYLEDKRVAERKRKEAVESIPKWEAQLEGVLRKHINPSALRHKARLVESLKEAYGHAGKDPKEVDALLVALEAKVAAERAGRGAGAGAEAPRAEGGGAVPRRVLNNTFGALAESDDE
jgi:hypothetical protein